jgi:hypothetical protein
VTGGVGGLVEVNYTRADVRFEVPLQWGTAIGNRCEMAGSNKYYIYPLIKLHQLRSGPRLTVVVVFEE